MILAIEASLIPRRELWLEELDGETEAYGDDSSTSSPKWVEKAATEVESSSVLPQGKGGVGTSSLG